MTLAEALDEATVDVESPMIITVNDAIVDKSNIGRFELSDNAEICVMPILSGG